MPSKKEMPAPAKKQPAKQSKKSAKLAHPKAPITFRNNILPPLFGIMAFVEVLAILNLQWIVAQYRYHFSKPSYITMSKQAADTSPNAAARLYIPVIDVNAPIVTGNHTFDETKVEELLESGVVQYGSSVDPGQKGNVIILGHSSSQVWAPGDYKFVFTLLNKLENNDRIYIDFKGQRYVYRIVDKTVLPPTDISPLHPTDTPILTLISSTPVGTSQNRLAITAQQISPDPGKAKDAGPTREISITSLP